MSDGSSATWAALDEVREILNDRHLKYGDARRVHEIIASLWDAWLVGRGYDMPHRSLRGQRRGRYPLMRAHDAAMMLMLLKVARLTQDPYSKDSARDMIGYAAIYNKLVEEE